MARMVQVVMVVPCEHHTQVVMQSLDEEGIRDWVVVPTQQCRLLGEIGYWPPVREHGHSVVLGMAEVAKVNGLVERLRRAVHSKGLCAECVVYSWPSEAVPLSEVAFDPVCRMAVDKHEAVSATFEGTSYYFCSEECRGRFLDSPTAFVRRAA